MEYRRLGKSGLKVSALFAGRLDNTQGMQKQTPRGIVKQRQEAPAVAPIPPRDLSYPSRSPPPSSAKKPIASLVTGRNSLGNGSLKNLSLRIALYFAHVGHPRRPKITATGVPIALVGNVPRPIAAAGEALATGAAGSRPSRRPSRSSSPFPNLSEAGLDAAGQSAAVNRHA